MFIGARLPSLIERDTQRDSDYIITVYNFAEAFLNGFLSFFTGRLVLEFLSFRKAFIKGFPSFVKACGKGSYPFC